MSRSVFNNELGFMHRLYSNGTMDDISTPGTLLSAISFRYLLYLLSQDVCPFSVHFWFYFYAVFGKNGHKNKSVGLPI